MLQRETMAEDDAIDVLLERYLQLLDGYTKLRAELSELQSSVYHSLARANFSAERGIRYGQDFYDERMQATKIISTEHTADGLPSFTLVDLNDSTTSDGNDTTDIEQKLEQASISTDDGKGDEDKRGETSTSEPAPSTKVRDPLRWFGILSPPTLRQAQNSASSLVATSVKLSTIDAEMKGLEIEIRRARKRKAKTEKMTSPPTQEHEVATGGK